MIFRSIAADTPFYRALTPRWAHMPESGAGAAVAGGRFNRPGIEARYVADSPEAALREYQRESDLLPPATVVTYLVSTTKVVDFTGGFAAGTWSEIWADAYCNWRAIAFASDTESRRCLARRVSVKSHVGQRLDSEQCFRASRKKFAISEPLC
jgi:RES domain-containing protein